MINVKRATIRSTCCGAAGGAALGRRIALLSVLVSALVSIAALLAAAPALGQPPVAAGSADAARDSLRRQSFPWYDTEKDSEKPVSIVADPDETGQRDSKWLSSSEWRARNTAPRVRTNFSVLRPVFQVVFWILVAGMLLGLSYAVIVAFMKMDAKAISGGGAEEEEDEEEDKTRIENLPFQVKRPGANLLNEAKACYERGDYNDAIVYLYSHQLVELDRRHAIYLTKGKTNRQYLRELRERPALQELLEGTVLVFEESFFGGHPISREKFERCWDRLPDFNRELERVTT